VTFGRAEDAQSNHLGRWGGTLVSADERGVIESILDYGVMRIQSELLGIVD